MKIRITELRDMVAEVVRRTLSEAPKKGSKRPPKDIPMHSEESEDEQRERSVRATGYTHSDVNDFSKPLGPLNRYKHQGASNMGGWTAEAVIRQKIKELQVRKLVRMIVGEEVQARRGKR